MKHRYLIHSLNHTILLVDITEIGLPDEVYPPEGREQLVSSLRLQSWLAAEQFLLRAGAEKKQLARAWDLLKAKGVAVLTI